MQGSHGSLPALQAHLNLGETAIVLTRKDKNGLYHSIISLFTYYKYQKFVIIQQAFAHHND